MVKPKFSKVGTELQMDILDKKHKVVVIEDSPYDPMNEKIRAKNENLSYSKKSN